MANFLDDIPSDEGGNGPMNWFSGGSNPTNAHPDSPSFDAVSYLGANAKDDIMESLGIIGGMAANLGAQVFSMDEGRKSDAFKGFEQRMEAQPDNTSLIDKVSNKIDSASNWLEKHKKLTELVTGAIGGAYVADEKRKAADAAQQGRINEQNNSARIAQEQNAAFSASISGLAPRKKGLINQTPLKRLDGSNVFDKSGKVV